MKRKKIRKNRYKKTNAGKLKPDLHLLLSIFSFTTLMIFTSIVYVYCYEYIIRPEFFKAEHLTISGGKRLSENKILKQAGIKPMDNILAINLSGARNRLLAHPWINDAEISRIVPNGIKIKIVEHNPIAVIDLGKKYLISDKGIIFKTYDFSDPKKMPIIIGLKYSDIHIYPVSNRSYKENKEAFGIRKQTIVNDPFDSAMKVLMMSLGTGASIPYRLLKKIQVDRKLGLTLIAFSDNKTIKIGYQNYTEKFAILSKVMRKIKNVNKKGIQNFTSIDLNNLNRIVVRPVLNATG